MLRLASYGCTRWLNAHEHETLAPDSGERLGLYFERLWCFGFRHILGYDRVVQNQVVEREGRTLGAFDILAARGTVWEHWELACKFYLQVGSRRNPRFWIGLNPADCLGDKLRHLAQHQLLLGEMPESRVVLEDLGCSCPHPNLALRGRLFPRLKEQGRRKLSRARLGWMFQDEFEHVTGSGARNWWVLPRSHWLSPLLDADLGLLRPYSEGMCLSRPLMVGHVGAHGIENQRWVLVPRTPA